MHGTDPAVVERPYDGCGRCLLGVRRLSRVKPATSSPERQRESVLTAAASVGGHIIGWADDGEVSGATDPMTRPKLGPWLRDERGPYDGLVAAAVDRLGRNVVDSGLHSTTEHRAKSGAPPRTRRWAPYQVPKSRRVASGSCEELLAEQDEPDLDAGRAGEAQRLTDSERRVVHLAVPGYTNREIAAKLYVTSSTVEQHLTRVYRKLDVKRRKDLPADLGTASPTGRTAQPAAAGRRSAS